MTSYVIDLRKSPSLHLPRSYPLFSSSLQVLCLHVKRFRWSTYSRTKIDTPVEFPLSSLDMSSYTLRDGKAAAGGGGHDTRKAANASSSLYDLAAVIVHHGSG